MKQSRLAALGIACGLVIWIIVSSIRPASLPPNEPAGRIFSECDGQLRTLVMQYVAEAGFVDETYRQFLSKLPSDVLVYIACPDQQTYDALVAQVGQVSCTLRPAITHHPISTWSRDRWAGLQGLGKTIMLAPRGELGAEGWEARTGDARIASTLARIFPTRAVALTSDLYFDAGDILADADNAFITTAVSLRNIQHTVADRAELTRKLEEVLQKRAVLLEQAPDHHAGMFMMAIGHRRVLVGDPSLAKPLWQNAAPWQQAGQWQPDFGDSTQQLFDAVAGQLEQEGYKVTRIATIPGKDGKAYITYTNVLIDQRPGDPTVYLPCYAGLDSLNHQAEQTWAHLGFRVISIDCTQVFRLGGTLHCLVNVLEKSH